MRRAVVGVMGGGDVGEQQAATAYEVGRLVAGRGWVLLNGGRGEGVMDASARGAREAGGLVVGILPDDHDGQASRHLDVAILTGMGSARNNVNVLSSDVVIACAGDAGTLSEIALALKARRPVITVGFDVGEVLPRHARSGLLQSVSGAAEAVSRAADLLAGAAGPRVPGGQRPGPEASRERGRVGHTGPAERHRRHGGQ